MSMTLEKALDILNRSEIMVLNRPHKQFLEAGNMAIKALEDLVKEEKKSRWIPVTEQLPDRNKSVLVRCANTTIQGGHVTHIGSCDSERIWFLKTQPDTLSFPFRDWKVTHWMPLPEPPKEEHHENQN